MDADGKMVAYGNGGPTEYASGLPSGFFGGMDFVVAREGRVFLASWSPTSLIEVVPGGVGPWTPLLESPAISALVGVDVDPETDLLYLADYGNDRVMSYDVETAKLSHVATLIGPVAALVGCDGNLYVAQHFAATVAKVDPTTGSVTPFVTELDHPEGLTKDAWGHMYVGMNNGHIVRFDPSGESELLIQTGVDVDRITWFGGGLGRLSTQACTKY